MTCYIRLVDGYSFKTTYTGYETFEDLCKDIFNKSFIKIYDECSAQVIIASTSKIIYIKQLL